MEYDQIPVCLTIAGSDSGGGAGIQADLRTFNALGVYGASAVTAVTAQNPNEVSSIHAIPATEVQAQLEAVFSAYEVGCVKTGMLSSRETIKVVTDLLSANETPTVIDPVMVSTSGARLLQLDAVEILVHELLPIAAIVTPNLPEAELILGREIGSSKEMVEAALEIADDGPAVYLKGGHLAETPGTDILVCDGEVYQLSAPTIDCPTSHGTGCTLSAALAAKWALHAGIRDAAVAAKAFVWQSLAGIRSLGANMYGLYPPSKLDASIVSVHRLR